VSQQSYAGFATPSATTTTFAFGSPYSARYVRVHATRLSSDQYGNYYLQFSEVGARG